MAHGTILSLSVIQLLIRQPSWNPLDRLFTTWVALVFRVKYIILNLKRQTPAWRDSNPPDESGLWGEKITPDFRLVSGRY
jgi:hypothetical protein